MLFDGSLSPSLFLCLTHNMHVCVFATLLLGCKFCTDIFRENKIQKTLNSILLQIALRQPIR